MLRAILLLFALTAAGFAQDNASADESPVSRLRAAAARYTDRLQDFFCIETLVRYTAKDGAKLRWKTLERRELEVTYTNKRPHYLLFRVDGKTDKLERRIKPGYFLPGGEFGALAWIFDEKARPDLSLDHRETVAGREICVFRYRIPLERTNITMDVNLEKVKLGHSGFVHADCESADVLRVQIATDPGTAYSGRIPVGMKLDVHYAPARIGESEFLLPHHAELMGMYDRTLTRADIEFSGYRRYESNSTISFEPESRR